MKQKKKKGGNIGLLLWVFERQIVQISIFFYWSVRGQAAVLPSLILKEIS